MSVESKVSICLQHWYSKERELTLICEVVTQAKHKLGCLAFLGTVLVYKPLSNLSLVDETRADFKVGLSGHDFDIVVLDHGLLEFLLHSFAW